MSTSEDIEKKLLNNIAVARAAILSQRGLIKRNLDALQAIRTALGQSGEAQPAKQIRNGSERVSELEKKFKAWADSNTTAEFTAMDALAGIGVQESKMYKIRSVISRCILRGEIEVCGVRSTGPWRPARVYRKKAVKVAEGEFGRY